MAKEYTVVPNTGVNIRVSATSCPKEAKPVQNNNTAVHRSNFIGVITEAERRRPPEFCFKRSAAQAIKKLTAPPIQQVARIPKISIITNEVASVPATAPNTLAK